MTKTRVIGDVHGHKYELSLILGNLPTDVTEVIQVGDLGVGFGQGDHWHESLDDMMVNVNGSFIRGNHDSPKQCKEMRSWIPDGTVRNDWFFAGGAWSIDQARRTPGVSWWEDEEMSYDQFFWAFGTYLEMKPRVVITHDLPKSVSGEMFFSEGKPLYRKPQHNTRTGSALEAMLEYHQPELWIAGHWHYDAELIVDKTRFICLNELSYIDVNRETLELDFEPIWRPI